MRDFKKVLRITPNHVNQMDELYREYSKYLHSDPSTEGYRKLPSFDKLLADIEKLEDWHGSIKGISKEQ